MQTLESCVPFPHFCFPAEAKVYNGLDYIFAEGCKDPAWVGSVPTDADKAKQDGLCAANAAVQAKLGDSVFKFVALDIAAAPLKALDWLGAGDLLVVKMTDFMTGWVVGGDIDPNQAVEISLDMLGPMLGDTVTSQLRRANDAATDLQALREAIQQEQITTRTVRGTADTFWSGRQPVSLIWAYNPHTHYVIAQFTSGAAPLTVYSIAYRIESNGLPVLNDPVALAQTVTTTAVTLLSPDSRPLDSCILAPSIPAAQRMPLGDITLRWAPPNGCNPAGYQVRMSFDGKPEDSVVEQVLTTDTYTIPSIDFDTDFYWHVRLCEVCPDEGAAWATDHVFVGNPTLLNVSPSTVTAGTSVSITASGLQPGERVALNGPLEGDPPANADVDGTVVTTMRVPWQLPRGTYVVAISGNQSGQHLLANLSVQAAAPVVSVSPAHAQEGATVRISGSGFLKGETVFVNGPAGGTFTADQYGSFDVNQPVRQILPPGEYTIDARGKDSEYLVTTRLRLSRPPSSERTHLSLTSSSVKVGDSLGVQATGFQAGSTVEFRMRSSTATAVADASGTARTTLVIKPFEPPVEYFVTAMAGSTDYASAPLTVTRPSPRVALSPSKGTWGTLITIDGAGFLPRERVRVSGYWGPPVFVDADGLGGFEVETSIGSAPEGNHAIFAVASESGDEAYAQLSVGAP